MPCGQDLSRTRVGHVQQVWFHNVELGEDDVEWREKDSPYGLLLQARSDDEVKVAQNGLVFRVRRRRHVVLSVDQLVPLPIVREQQEIVVGELQTRSRDA